MARVWKTGVAKGAVLRSAAPSKNGKNRKTRTTMQIRAGKLRRAARRAAAADTGSKDAAASTALTESTTAGHKGSRTDASERESRHGPSAESPPRDVTQTREFSDTLRTSYTGASGTASAVWVCMICTNANLGGPIRCTSCNFDRPKVIYDDVPGDTSGEGVSIAQAVVGDDTAIATDQSTIATDRTAVATSRKTTDQIYYPIYGEYYTGQDVTVTRKFATTVEVWQVAYINNRREPPLGMLYRVLWVHPDRSCRHLYLRTWEPAARLREDDFVEEIDLVDRWKASTVPLFEDFWREDEVGMGLLGADDDGLCVFNALRHAAELAGRPDIVTQQDIDQFVEDRLVLYSRDLREGATWTDVRDFMIRLREAGRDIAYNAFVKNNYSTPGRRGARVLTEIKVPDGIYIIGAYNHRHIGHGAVLTVQGNKRLIYDLMQGKPISSAKGWINFYAFVRPFIVFK